MTAFEFTAKLREEFESLLRGPGITWNLNGVMNTLDKAVALVALKHLDDK